MTTKGTIPNQPRLTTITGHRWVWRLTGRQADELRSAIGDFAGLHFREAIRRLGAQQRLVAIVTTAAGRAGDAGGRPLLSD